MVATLAAMPEPQVELPVPTARVSTLAPAAASGGDDETSEAVPAATASGSEEGSFLDDGPVWPSEDAESAFRAEARERGESVAVEAALDSAEAEEEKKAVPVLDELMPKIPEPVRETLEELFRAKFVRVIRVRKKDLRQ